MVANDADCFLGFDVDVCPIRNKFMSKSVCFGHTPEKVIDGLIHTAVINLAKKIPANEDIFVNNF